MASGGLNYGSETNLASAQAVANGADLTTAAVDLSGKIAARVGIKCVYGGTATQGLVVHVLGLVAGSDYEAEADEVWQVALAYSVSGTHRRVLSVLAQDYEAFKVLVTNDSGASVTVTIDVALATLDMS